MSSTPRRNEEIRSRSCHWHSCRSKRNSNSAVTNELLGQRGRPPKHSPSERVACQVACACSENPALLTHSPHQSCHVPFRRPRRPTARGYKLMHVHAHAPCPLSCAAARAPAIPTARTYFPSGTPTQSPQRQPVAKRHAAMPMAPSVCHTHTHTPCNNELQPPRNICANASGQQRWPDRRRPSHAAGARAGSGPPRQRACDTHSQGQPSRTAPPACLSTHGTLAWGAEAARVRIYQTEEPNVGGGGGKDSVKIRESLFCLLSIRGNTVQTSDLHPNEVARPTRVVRSCTGFQDDHGDRQLGRRHARS